MNRAIFGEYTLQFLRELLDQETTYTVIDTDGSLAAQLSHQPDVFYFDPSGHKTLQTLNLFQGVHKKDKAKLVEDITAVLNSLFPAGQDTLTRLYANTVLPVVLTILLDNVDVSFADVLTFLTDSKLQKKYLAKCRHPRAELLWKTIQTWDDADRKRAYTLIQAMVTAILLSPVLSRTLLGTSTFSLTDKPFFIADLSRSKIGDQAARMLATLFASRAHRPVYITNFQFIASDYLASQFSQGGYTLATRFVSTLPPNVAQELMGFSKRYVFRTTYNEAKKLNPDIKESNIIALTILADGEYQALHSAQGN